MRLPLAAAVIMMSLPLLVSAQTTPADGWSAPVNGLQARLALNRTRVFNGTTMIVPQLELRNVSQVINPLHFVWDTPELKCTVADKDGNALPNAGVGVYSGPMGQHFEITLPPGGTLTFPVLAGGAGVPAGAAGMIDLGPSNTMTFQDDGKIWLFKARLDVAENKVVPKNSTQDWYGTITFPPLEVPLKAQPMDPNTAAKLIEQYGPQLLEHPGGNASMEALGKLSLIDDERVIPWYVKAVQTGDYEMKFNALDQLARYPGDAALEGLKIGMTTRGIDIGNSSTAEVNIRVQAAHALARSSNPDAKRLLATMLDDPNARVRLTAMQRLTTKPGADSDAILKRMTADKDDIVRGEAERILKEHTAH